MLQVSDREKEGWLDIESIQAFPSVDLNTINQRWLKYSEGRFGFSLQKWLYLDSGGNPDGLNDADAWGKFGQRVKWNIGGKWISYKQLGFYTSAPDGHLPVLWGGNGWRSDCANIDLDAISVLFSRRDLPVTRTS
jgi:hypothetical protein